MSEGNNKSNSSTSGSSHSRPQQRQRRSHDRRTRDRRPQEKLLQERVVHINRVSKAVKGGRRFSFTALVVVGDGEKSVGVGYGKANEVPLAIQKAIEKARRSMVVIPKHGATITHPILGIHGSARVLLKPAAPGTGVIAGGAVRPALELAGIQDILSKSLGSQNPINLVYATLAALTSLRTPRDVAASRGISIDAVLGLKSEAT